MTPAEFISKWKVAELKERAACQEHFLDLCAVLGEKTPAAADPKGEWYTFEYGLKKDGGGQGFADVWKKGHFGWEYKGKRKDLNAAFNQLAQYRGALENPPLLIVCDLNCFEIHTNFNNKVKEVHTFDLDGLADAKNLNKLRLAFTNPNELEPGRTQAQVTEEVAAKFAQIAKGMRQRNIEAHEAGQFLMKIMFCMFAEDMELLPRNLFLETVRKTKFDSRKLTKPLKTLFEAMADKDGMFGNDEIPWFNGGLFKDTTVIELTNTEVRQIAEAAEADWSDVEPSIFGTLFERILNPGTRSQLGAHYTSREDIETLVQPVMMAQLRREWAEVKTEAEKILEAYKEDKAQKLLPKEEAKPAIKKKRRRKGEPKEKPQLKTLSDFEKCLFDFHDRLAGVQVLDPACGSGNFLYVALHLLLDLEKEVLTYAVSRGLNRFPLVRPKQLHGIEINAYAQELAQVVIWIGYLQWMKFNGFPVQTEPILDSMENIECRDAILDLSDPANPKEPEWPSAEFIVGNPPFLGDKKMRGELGDEYVEQLRKLYEGRLPGQSDLVCYWFEKSRAMIEAGFLKRAGLIATQGIRGGANRASLDRVKTTGDIFFGISDRDWILDGASVHISMVGFDAGNEQIKLLDGFRVESINQNLSSDTNTTRAVQLVENSGISFIGTMKKAPLDIAESIALSWIKKPNVNLKPNSDILRPWMNGKHLTQRASSTWIVDYPLKMKEEEAAKYDAPFSYVLTTVKPIRAGHREAVQARYWWRQARPCPDLMFAIRNLKRYVCVVRAAKYRIYAWVDSTVVPDNALVAFSRDDDYFFGVIQTRIHETWAYAQGTQVRERESGFRYTPTTCFETYPFPEPTKAQELAIAAVANELDTLRNNWLNPPEWTKTEVLEFPGSVDGPWKRYVTAQNMMGIGTVKYPRLVPKDATAARELKKRTLTNLYNERPAWLANVHRKLDEAVFAAYGWSPDISNDELLAKLLALNLERAAKQ
jgi:hypothetical protein